MRRPCKVCMWSTAILSKTLFHHYVSSDMHHSVLPWELSGYPRVIYISYVFISAIICVLHLAVSHCCSIAWPDVILFMETVLWIPFSSTVTLSCAVDIILDEQGVFGSSFVRGAFAIRSDSVICAGCLSISLAVHAWISEGVGHLTEAVLVAWLGSCEFCAH